jgi:hypothetical protein
MANCEKSSYPNNREWFRYHFSFVQVRVDRQIALSWQGRNYDKKFYGCASKNMKPGESRRV